MESIYGEYRKYMEDVYENVRHLKSMKGCQIVTEKDYIRNAKPNGYRSYHMILI